MATKTITVGPNSCNPSLTQGKRTVDSIHFIQAGSSAPTTVTITAAPGSTVDPSTLFGTTTCTVDANASGSNVYAILANADLGNYSVDTPPDLRATLNAGTIGVTG
ncbi:MAG TPA: hypothetical protein VJ528_02315 [Geothrix sp.]|uniref:hypothetical protein n=1 Tax=Geothrix mesophila TaxID=2922723 RepID=UPI001FAC623D|nr:hypothetical protein [Geothrix sp. SG198]HJV37648.1 hypothetical protein [Geothrix sp.]